MGVPFSPVEMNDHTVPHRGLSTMARMAKDQHPENTPGGPSVKDGELYERLREEGNSKSKAAAIANAAANSSRQEVGEKGGKSGSYEDWSRDELYSRAQELDIQGRSDMTKDELIEALRND